MAVVGTTWPDIRDRIKEVLEGLDVGRVHPYIRSSKSWQDHLSRNEVDSKINVWEITRMGVPLTPASVDGTGGTGQEHSAHDVKIVGRLAVRDVPEVTAPGGTPEIPSEHIFQQQVEDVRNAFRGNPQNRLGDGAHFSPILISPMYPQVNQIDYIMWGSMLVHFTEITMTCIVREDVTL